MISSSTPIVALADCSGYVPPLLAERVDRVLSCLELPPSLHGRTVLLKPNLISSRGPALACTHPNFLAAVACWLHEQGARLKLGDSPAFGTTRSVLTRQGMLAPLAGLPVELVQFRTPVTRTLGEDVTVEVAAEALECDLLVNLPKLKAHNQLYMTGAVKNFFGTVVGMRKAMLHMTRGGSHREFAEMLLGLPELFTPHLSLVDAVEVMHRSGPLDGEPLMLGCIAGSRCPVALDTSLLEMLELDKADSPLWTVARESRHPSCTVENIRYPLSVPIDFHGSGFVAPAGLNPVRFHPLRLIMSAARRFRLALRG